MRQELSAAAVDGALSVDEGVHQANTVRWRRCILTREVGPSEKMLRFVASPDGTLYPDLAGVLPGRGMWVKAEGKVLASPKLAGAFRKAARGMVKLPEEPARMVADGLARRIQEGIALGRKAGKAVCGFQKCRERLVGRAVGLVLCAQGASKAECERLLSGCGAIPVAMVDEKILACAFGRQGAVYGVMAPGPLAQRVMTDCEKLAGLAGNGLLAPGGAGKEQAER
ncbi:DUF448 domain-containing protein [Formicincola oecophyllae]|uniref:DUF448 domain-containing protein n=2 Tax=Formicincola oecophyllae TaxID=2558361 RepID=A0A4Y6UEG3_9PROT|nr:DUF448 domain-containing protein [Formicincola oecophyllae]